MVESSTTANTTTTPADSYPFERILDPEGDRVMKDVPRPPRFPLALDQLFSLEKGM